jgi:uncharacterized membrane protein
LAYIDWLRGLACVLMFQTHCYDAWLGGAARDSKFAMWSHLGGTFPAPLFLFLSGISVAIVADKLLQKGAPGRQIGKKIMFRGGQIFALGLLFRIQEYVIAWGWAPWSDLFRVDILNTIGLGISLMGALCWAGLAVVGRRGEKAHDAQTSTPAAPKTQGRYLAFAGVAMAAMISAITPLLWTTWRPSFLPWPLETYINGVHNLGVPQPWLFPIFPWIGFSFAGLAVGFLLMSDFARKRGAWIFLACGAVGGVLVYAAKFVDAQGWQLYAAYDYWHTSPSFFALRAGMLLLLVLGAYAWCRWGPGRWGFSPLIQLGRTSLLVYWVHIEFVYGRFHILVPRNQTVLGASQGLLIIFLAMLVLSLARTKWKSMAPQLFAPRKSAGTPKRAEAR